MRTRFMPLLVACAALAGCPEERPGAQKQVPVQRVPPAVSVEPADAGVAPSGADSGALAR